MFKLVTIKIHSLYYFYDYKYYDNIQCDFIIFADIKMTIEVIELYM